MTIDDVCISYGVEDCSNCDGQETECIGYIPQHHVEFYNETKIGRIGRKINDYYQTIRWKMLELWRGEKTDDRPSRYTPETKTKT